PSLHSSCPRSLGMTCLHYSRHPVADFAIKMTAICTLPHPAPLLEEERYFRPPALIANPHHPLALHRSRSVPTLAADYHPVNPVEVELAEVFEQRLDGEEPHAGRGGAEMLDARQAVLAVFNAHPPPDVRLVSGGAE